MVRLRGGYSHNGRPAELVRIREGQTISLRNGEVIKSSDSPSMSPTFDSDCSDDEVLRSMGRRKKNAPPVKDVPRCSECEKTFKRPCDLTYDIYPASFLTSVLTGLQKTRENTFSTMEVRGVKLQISHLRMAHGEGA